MRGIENYKIIDAAGLPGSTDRLCKIASMDLGLRSEAAQRVLYKRSRRKELIDKGLTHEEACLIVNREEQEKSTCE